MSLIYLDGHATTPLAPEAATAMRAAWAEPGNASSPHVAGARAAEIVESGRAAVARLIGAVPSEIVFTSGATEANNMALAGIFRAARAANSSRHRLIVASIEHKSILACAEALRSEGAHITIAPVGRDGLVDLSRLAKLADENTLLVSVGAANGEIGVLQPVAEIAAIAHSVGAFAHSDLAQFAGKVPCDVGEAALDYASLSAHKMYGPGGVGALFVAAGALPPAALIHGGGQEQGLRSGTVPAPLVAGFGAAAELAAASLSGDAQHGRDLAANFLAALTERQITWRLNGHSTQRLPGSLNIQVVGVDAQSICERIGTEVAVSTGSACQSGEIGYSHVLQSIGLSQDALRWSIRLLFNRYNQLSEAIEAAKAIAVASQKEALAHWTPHPVA